MRLTNLKKMNEDLYSGSLRYLDLFCNTIDERCVGSEGNRIATRFFANELSRLGWETETAEFDAIDWKDGGARLSCDREDFSVLAGPYSLAYNGKATLVAAGSVDELDSIDCTGKILLLYGEIAGEQLMPKNFVFYNPEEHRRIIALLEQRRPAAIISATGRNAALAGGVYPFPLIEDGDFDIPSAYMTEEEGVRLLSCIGRDVTLESRSLRIPGKGYNVIARKGRSGSKKVVVTAHIDAKKGTPGAIDNATGVTVLLLLARQLKDYECSNMIELVAFNGEDYYAVPGQMDYLMANQGKFNEMLLNINIDGAGYKEGLSAFSLFDLPEPLRKCAVDVITDYPGITEGAPWPQGDHSIFLQNGVPAIAVSSKWFIDNIEIQDITHTPKDKPEIVDCHKLVEISSALNAFIRMI
jgi:aminopeptidase YwaD